MASDPSSDENLAWSDATQTIRDVVYSSCMPIIVRVAEGYYGESDAESFSRGDLLKLDFVKSIQKVYSTIVSSWSEAILEDTSGYIQPEREINIPLGYKGKVLVIRPPTEYRVFTTVAELMREFPRFVRVDIPFFAQSNKEQAICIEAGKKLELDRFLPTQGLIAKYENEVVVLNNSVKSRFVPLPDDTEYTLIEVIDRLPLPQFVRFVDDEFEKVLTTDLSEAVENVQSFTGCVKLKRVFREEVVVGHHKPQIPEYLKKEGDKYVHRSIVLLPLGRDIVNDIEVNTPIYSEPDEYQLLAVRNFSQKSPNMDIIDGSLYLEFSKKPRSYFSFKDDEEENKDEIPMDQGPPPPLPPRPKHYDYVSEDDDKKTSSPPKVPPRPNVEQEENYEPVGELSLPPVVAPRPKRSEQKHDTPVSSTETNPTVRKERKKQACRKETVSKPRLSMPVDRKGTTTTENRERTDSEADEHDGPLIIYEVPDEKEENCVPSPQHKHKVAVPKPFYKRLRRVQTELKSRLFTKTHVAKLHPVSPTIAVTQPLPSPTITSPESKYGPLPTSSLITQEARPRESPSLSRKPVEVPKGSTDKTVSTNSVEQEKGKHGFMNTGAKHGKAADQEKTKHGYINTAGKHGNPPKPKPKGEKKMKRIQEEKQSNENKDTKNKTDLSDEDDHQDYDYPDLSKMDPLPPPPSTQTQRKPIVRVQPSSRVAPAKTSSSRSLQQMSVKELVQCLHQCAIPKLASLCEENAIDGKFLSDLDDEELRDKPFSLNHIEVAKVKKMKEGWRPKLN